MPLFRFLVHGQDARVLAGKRGFYATRHAFAATQEVAAAKVLARLAHEFTSGASAHIWRSTEPRMQIEKAYPIGWHQLWAAPNKGSTFYDERE